MSTFLDLVSLAAGVGLIAASLGWLYLSIGGRDKTLRGLRLALRFARAAAACAAVTLVANVLDISSDGYFWPAVSVFQVVVWSLASYWTRQQRDAMGEQVMADAERTVRSYMPGGRFEQ